MKKLLNALIKNRKITIFFVAVIIAAGVISFISLPKQESPDISVPYARITTIYPGASQKDMDELVTEPIISAISEIDGYEESFSYSANSFSLVMVELEFSANRDESFTQMEDLLRELQNSLPEDCGIMKVDKNITDTAGVILSLSSLSADSDELVNKADEIISQLSDIDGFSRFQIDGERQKRIWVTLDTQKMVAAGLSVSETATLVGAGNLDIPMGDLSYNDEVLSTDYVGGYKSIDDLRNLEIGYSPELSQIITLEDIADITETEVDSATRYYTNGHESVMISGYFEDNINTLPLNKDIEEHISDIRDGLPKDMELSLVISQPEEIKDSLGNFSINLIVAIGLVILVVLIGMGFRNALVVSISIPFSILITFLVMYITDIRIHQISIAALIMSLGMIVDNSIVVSDSIQGALDSGNKRKKACSSGAKEVAGPVIASTITTIAAFAPFLFLNSIAGDYIQSLPKIISITLAASYVTAMFVIPVIGYIVFKKHKKSKNRYKPKVFPQLLKWGMNKKVMVFVVVAVLMAGSVFLALDIDKEFFPASDKDIVYIDITNNNGDDIDETDEIVQAISELLEAEDMVLDYTASVGGGLPRFNQIMFVYSKTPDVGQIMIKTDPDNDDFDSNGEFKEYLQKKIDAKNLNAKITVKQLMYAFPMNEDIRIRLLGENPDIVKNTEAVVFNMLLERDDLSNLSKGNTEYVDSVELDIDSKAAAKSYILPAEVINEISIAVNGRETTVIYDDGKEIPVYVTGGINDLEQLDSYMIKTGDGQYVSGGDLIEISIDSELQSIPRYNESYSMLLTADYGDSSNTKDTLEEIKDDINSILPEGVSVMYEGEDELIKENFSQVFVMGAVALVIVFMILLIQFKSFGLPLLIFVTIPLSAIGSITGLYVSGLPISFTALLGIVSLLGIVVNNAIILIDYITKEMKKGIKAAPACMNAANRRLRPILLSTITTVIGLIPLVIGSSQLFKPMAVALMSGLLVSTLLTLVVIPIMASLILKAKDSKG